jgi:F0F1-type ATP synthase assembly protein I
MKADVRANEPSIKSDAGQWIQWHKDLKRVFGKKTANSIWLAFWAKRKSSAANTHELRSYAESQGFKVESDAIAGIIDGAYDIADTIGDVFQVTKYVGIGLAVILVGGLGILVFNIAKKPIETMKAAASLKTGGM